MASVLERELIVVTGKGGVGKTTISAALGVLGARRGLRTIVVEVGEQQRLPALLGRAGEGEPVEPGVELDLGDGLWSLTIDPDRVLRRWLAKLGGRVSARVLGSSSTFQYFVAAAPGAREMLSLVELWELRQAKRKGLGPGYDLVILDAPATGHALAMLRSPRTFAAIARVGPLAGQAERVQALLADPARSGYLAVALGTEMAVTETLELQDALRGELGRELDATLLNGALPQRFEQEDLSRIEALDLDQALVGAAARGARAAHERSRTQQSQVARLRRRGGTAGASSRVLSVPFVFRPQIEAADIHALADVLERKL